VITEIRTVCQTLPEYPWRIGRAGPLPNQVPYVTYGDNPWGSSPCCRTGTEPGVWKVRPARFLETRQVWSSDI